MSGGHAGMRGLDATLKTSATVVLAVAGALVTWRVLSRKTTSRVPHLGSWIPYVGQGAAYFSAMCEFINRNRIIFDGSFSATIFGTQWVFLFNKEDINSVVRAAEKHASMYIAISGLAGSFLPFEDPRDYKDAGMRAKLSRGSSAAHWDGVPSVAMFVYSLRAKKMRAWVLGLRKAVQTNFATLPNSGEIDLFEFCSKSIGEITLFALFGNAVPDDEVKRFVKLFEEAEMERAFEDPIVSLRTMVEVAVFGERHIYRQIREVVFPFLDQEIERVIAGAKEPEDASVMTSMVHWWFQNNNKDVALLRAARRRIVNDCILFMFAAITNSFANAAWLIFHVIRNTQGTGDRIRAEQQAVPDDSDTLPELEKVIYEISRLYSPGQITRKLLRPWVMPSTGQELPAGCMISVPTFEAHRDPSVFADPLEFDPQRFDPSGRDERGRAGGMFMGFGAGVHPCVGRKFAVLETSLFVSEALKGFEWELVGDDTRPEDAFTQASINLPRHPKLNRAQPNSIFRTLEPLIVRYKRKEGSKT